MQSVPFHLPMVSALGRSAPYLTFPIFMQPVAMPVTMPVPKPVESHVAELSPEELILRLNSVHSELEHLPSTQETSQIRLRLRNLLFGLRQSPASVASEGKVLVEKLVKELLLRCRQVHPVDVWTLLRNKGCQFLAQQQAIILQSLIFVLRASTVLPRKQLIELIVETCTKNGADVSKTSVGRVVQLLYRSGCFFIHKDDADDSNILAQQAKNTRMQLRDEFFDYDALRRTHDGLIVQWAHEEGLFLSAERWSQMLYHDKVHKAHMQAVVDQKTLPLVKWIDMLYQHARSVPAVAKCMPILQQYASIPSVSSDAPSTELDTHLTLLCVLELASTYVQVVRTCPYPVNAPSRASPSEVALSKGRPVIGARHTPLVSPGSSQDEDARSAASPVMHQINSTLFSARMSPNSMNSPSSGEDDFDTDSSDERMSTELPCMPYQQQSSPVQSAKSALTNPQVPLNAIERWISGAQPEQRPATTQNGWDAWKGGLDLLHGTNLQKANNSFDFNKDNCLDVNTEDSLISTTSTAQFLPANTASDVPSRVPTFSASPNGKCKMPYERMVSSTAAENLLRPSWDSSFQRCDFSSLMRVASFEDPNYLHM